MARRRAETGRVEFKEVARASHVTGGEALVHVLRPGRAYQLLLTYVAISDRLPPCPHFRMELAVAPLARTVASPLAPPPLGWLYPEASSPVPRCALVSPHVRASRVPHARACRSAALGSVPTIISRAGAGSGANATAAAAEWELTASPSGSLARELCPNLGGDHWMPLPPRAIPAAGYHYDSARLRERLFFQRQPEVCREEVATFTLVRLRARGHARL